MRTLIFLLVAAIPAFGADTIDVGSQKQARHSLMPIVGYQSLNGEKRGIDWSLTFHGSLQDGLPDSIYSYSGSIRGEDDINPPVIGLQYRFRINEMLSVQASMAVIQDRQRYEYPAFYEFFAFTVRDQIKVERSNTTWLNAGGAWSFDTPLSWLTGLAQLDFGYATRSITRSRTLLERPNSQFTVKYVEDEEMFSVRGGVEAIIWRDDNLLIQGGISYAQFFPANNDTDPFGGIGWRFSVFPVWSGQ